jgi:hypothetical protein
MDPIAAARMGMMFAQRELAESADRVARFGAGEDVDMVREAVTQIQAKHQFVACAHMVSFADDMWRTLLNLQRRD